MWEMAPATCRRSHHLQKLHAQKRIADEVGFSASKWGQMGTSYPQMGTPSKAGPIYSRAEKPEHARISLYVEFNG